MVAGAILAVPSTDTLKAVDAAGLITATPARAGLWRALTPQVFRWKPFVAAYEQPDDVLAEATDDAALVEAMGGLGGGGRGQSREPQGDHSRRRAPGRVAPPGAGRRSRVRRSDRGRARTAADARAVMNGGSDFRVGLGIDAHRFASDRPLVLGGVRVRDRDGLSGHSDADVVAHALMDALLGAAGLEDIGHYFPDSDPAFAGADSMGLLARVADVIAREGWRVANVDIVVVCRAAAHRPSPGGHEGPSGGGVGRSRGPDRASGHDHRGHGVHRAPRGHHGPVGGASGALPRRRRAVAGDCRPRELP